MWTRSTFYCLAGIPALLAVAPNGFPQLAGGDPACRYNRARQALEKKDYDTAAKEWEAIVRLAPELPEAHSNLGLMYHMQRKYEQAIEQFHEALRLHPKLLSASLFLGIDYYLTSRPDLAIEHRHIFLS